MEQDIETVIRNSRPNLRDITISSYVSKIGKFIENNDITKPEESIRNLHSKYKEKTVKSYLIAVNVYLQSIGKEDVAKVYAKEMKKLNDSIQEKEMDQEATEMEKKNMVKREEIKKLIDSLKQQFSNLALKRDAFTYFELYKRYLVLNLYYLIPPLRNDFIGCEVHEEQVSQNLEKNYIFLNKGHLVLNRYKTRNAYGTGNIINIPDDLVTIVRNWIKIRNVIRPELEYEKELLLTQDFKPMRQVNLTQFLNRIFGRNVSSTMLRKSYLTEKYPVTKTANEMHKDAIAMTHSVTTQQTIYRKK